MVPTGEPVTVRLYGNRRLYQGARGRYVTLDELVAAANEGVEITVRAARSGADITDFILSRGPTEH